jgi:TetR/AcrR family transcriptional regulator, regulator of autoinduction and epiphytic fitness
MSTESPTEDAPKVDGRRLRAERTRAAIVDALLALIEEGDLRPTAPRVAERASVSLRTVFQHFAEVEVLFAAVSERQVERIAEHAEPIDPSLPLPERVDAYVAQRCRILEFVTPVARAASLQEHDSPKIAAESERLRDLGRMEIASTFGAELDTLEAPVRHRLRSAIEALTTWKAWDVVRRETGLEPDDAQEQVRFHVRAVFAAAGLDLDA